MLNYSFVKTPEEVIASRNRINTASGFTMQEKIQMYWTVDEALVRHVLPPHIEPHMPQGKPIILAYIAFFGRPQYYYPYTEGALYVLAKSQSHYDGRMAYGVYPLAMPLDASDQPMDSGRQYYGYPKKQGFVKLERRGDKLRGWIERNDVRFFDVEVTLDAGLNDPEMGPKVIGKEGPYVEDGEVILLKYDMDSMPDPNPKIDHCFRNFRLQAQRNIVNFREKRYARVDKMVFEPSEDDPWIELAPKRPEDIYGAIYAKYDTDMKQSRLLYTYTEDEYAQMLPYAWPAWDTCQLGKEHSSHRTENFWR